MKTKNIILAALFFIASCITMNLFAQDERELPNFDKITVSQGVHVVYKQSDRYYVGVVTSDKKVSKDVVTNVNNGVLEIGLKTDHDVKKRDVVTVYVENPCLKQIYTLRGASFKTSKISGGCEFKVIQNKNSLVEITDLDVTDNVDLVVFGKSKLTVKKLTASNLNLTMKNESRSNIEEIHVENGMNVKSEGKSFATIGGETPKLRLKGESMKCLDTRNLACNSIDFFGI